MYKVAYSYAYGSIRHAMNPSVTTPSPHTGLAWHLSQLALSSKQNKATKLHVYICPDVRSYRLLSEELGFFLQAQPELLWHFPAWEVLPYDRVSPHHGIVGERFSTLGRLLKTPNPQGILITALPAWLQRIAPPESVAAHVWQLKEGDLFDVSVLKEKLAEAGMVATERVLAQGEFAARGGLLDIWPATEHQPLRIDLFGDEIESIRRFDPETQRSGDSLKHFTSVPVREVILDEQGRETFVATFRARFPQHRKHPMTTAVQAGRPHPGIEALLPFAYKKTARFLDYLPAHAHIIADADIEVRRDAFANQVRSQFEMVRASSEPTISPQELYAVETKVEADNIDITKQIQTAPDLTDFQSHKQPLHALHKHLQAMLDDGWRLLLIAHGLGQQERMSESLHALQTTISHCTGVHDMPKSGIATAIGSLETGFALKQEKVLLLTGRELLGQRLPRKRGRGTVILHADAFTSIAELKLNDPVVHEDHGVGRYLGLESMDDDGEQSDFIKIAYADKAQVFIPVEDLDRYTVIQVTTRQH